MNSDELTRLKERFGGPMTASEAQFLRQIQRVIEQGQASALSLRCIIDMIWEDMKQLSAHRFDVDEAITAGLKLNSSLASERDSSQNNAVENRPGITREEQQFLTDVHGLIEFAFRNGIGFSLVLEVLIHDFKEIRRAGSLQSAEADGFWPKASGWSNVNDESVGSVDEEME
jgi:hypothetical protein